MEGNPAWADPLSITLYRSGILESVSFSQFFPIWPVAHFPFNVIYFGQICSTELSWMKYSKYWKRDTNIICQPILAIMIFSYLLKSIMEILKSHCRSRCRAVNHTIISIQIKGWVQNKLSGIIYIKKKKTSLRTEPHSRTINLQSILPYWGAAGPYLQRSLGKRWGPPLTSATLSHRGQAISSRALHSVQPHTRTT